MVRGCVPRTALRYFAISTAAPPGAKGIPVFALEKEIITTVSPLHTEKLCTKLRKTKTEIFIISDLSKRL